MTTRAFGYVRVSTAEQLKSTLGVRAYIEQITRHAEAKGLDLGRPTKVVVGTQVFDSRERIVIEDVSASKVPFYKRKGAHAICDAIEPGEALIVAKVDRAFRNIRDALNTTAELLEAGVKLYFLDMGGADVDMTQGIGKFMLCMFAFFAEWEAGKMSERIIQANVASRAAGRGSISHTPKPGFKFVGKGRDRKEVPDPEQLALIREVWTWKRTLGWGRDRIEKELNARKVPILRRAAHDRSAYGDVWGPRPVMALLEAGKRFQALLEDTGLIPESGQRWLEAYQERYVEERTVRKERRRLKAQREASQKLKAKLRAEEEAATPRIARLKPTTSLN